MAENLHDEVGTGAAVGRKHGKSTDKIKKGKASNMETLTSEKIQVLLDALDRQFSEWKEKESTQQLIFQWVTNLLLVAFAAVLALADKAGQTPNPIVIRIFATILIVVPTALSIKRISDLQNWGTRNGAAIDRIQKLLNLFEIGYYGEDSVYPSEWLDSMGKLIAKRSHPRYYGVVMGTMAICVVVTVWLIL